MTRPGVLLTRPREESDDVAREVEAIGYRAVIEPLLSVVPVDFTPPHLSRYAGLVFTSAHAPRFFPAAVHPDIPVYTVGDHTAQAAQAAGYHNVQSASGDLNDLEKMISGLPGNFLYVRGMDISRPPHQVMDDVIVYQAVKTTALSPAGLAFLDEGAISYAMFFSARTAAVFTEIIRASAKEARIKGIRALCIGPGMVESLSVLPWQGIEVAATPDRHGMLALLPKIDRQ